MNVSQIGQKKKKQAVRRLSHGSGGQGNRKLDIRRKLEANRRVAGTGSTAGEGRGTRGNLKSAQTHESRASRPFSGDVKRILAHAQSASKRHASPLTSTASTTGNKQETNAFLNPTATEVTQGNVFGSNVLKSSPTQETVSGMQQAKNNQESVFQSKGRPTLNQGNVFGSNRGSSSTTFSVLASDSLTTKSHPSPLTSLTNSPSKAGGSIVSGVASKGNAENSNVSSLVNKYEDKTTQPSFQTTSNNMFQSNIASMDQSPGLQSIFPQTSVFSAEQHAPLDPSKSAQIFGSSLNTISSSTPPNVNLFASNQAKPVPLATTTEHSTINITPFSGYMAIPGNRVPNTENNVVNLEKRPGMFASTMQSPTKRSHVFNQSSNPVGSTSPNRSINLDPIGSTNPTVMNQNSPLKKGSIFGNTANSTEQGNSARIRDSSDSKPNTFASRPFSLSSASQSHTLFNTAGQTPPNPASVFGTAGSSKTSGMLSTTQTSGPFSSGSKSTTPVFSQVSKPGTVFENVGSSSGQQESSGMFSSSKNPTLGPFSRKTSNAAVSSQPKSGSIFGSSGQVSTFASAGVFSKQSKATFGNVSAVPQTQESSRENSSASERRKGPRRSLSNTDTSNLTSILIKDLGEEYLNKKLLEREFAIFGQNKVTLQPTKQSAIVNFANHESAKEAKSKAAQLFPFKNAHVFWCKKKGTGRLSKTPEKPTDNKQEFRSRRSSISSALNNIDVSKLPPAMSAQERFTTLDEVDKRIRQAITPYRDIANAPVVVGVCCDMCPEKERYMREYQANLSIFEMIPGTQDNRDGDVPKVDHIKAVKEYSRSAADKLEPLSHELRPVHVLQMTLDYLMTNVMDNSEEKRDEWFNFLWNRTRAIRKDITQQHLCDVQSVDLVEKITRFHIFCAHYLCEEDMHSFDPKINNENLTKCLQTLKQFYLDLYTDQEVKCSNEAEFQAYDILLNLNEGDTLRKAMQYRLEVRNSPEVKFALEVFSSLSSHNFVRFFKLLKSATYLNACIMHRYFTQVRRNALRVMTKAYSPKEPYPLLVLQDLLAFEDQDEASRFCSHYNFTTNEGHVQFSKMSFTDPETAFPMQRAINVVESKRNCSVGEIVNGSPLNVLAIHQPVSSFDADGRYIGLSRLAQMLQSTPDTPEPDSPYDMYESSLNLSSEQQSPVAQVPADDPGVILNKAIESTCVDLVDETVVDMVQTISEDAVRQVDFELQLTNDFADTFVNDSLSIMLKEIAQECIKNELEIRRRKAEVAESRARMSVVVMNEFIRDFLKNELVAVAEDAKRMICQQLKVQSFARMSAVVMREMVEDVMNEQCHEVAVSARKDIVKQKKAVLWKKAEIVRRRRLKRCFQRWSKEYHTRIHIRNILKEMPANPPMLSTKQQLDKLLSNQDPTGKIPTTPALLSSLIKEREELQKLLTDKVEEQEMKRLRAMQPINLRRLYTELDSSQLNSSRSSDCNDCMKLLVSFANHVEHFSLTRVESLIKFKLRSQNVAHCRPVPAELQKKFEQLSEKQVSPETLGFKYDVKACYGCLSSDELRKAQQHSLLLGLTGVIFIVDPTGEPGDKTFWSNCRTRLTQILRSKPHLPGIPVVIMNINSIVEQSLIEDQLDIDALSREGLISDCAVYAEQDSCDSDQLHNQLIHVLLWLMSHRPASPLIQKTSLKSFVEREILKHFTTPVYEETTLRKEALLQPQCPEVIVGLYNAVIDHIIAMLTNVKLKDISLPIPELIAADCLPVSWNSSGTLLQLHSILRKLKLPLPSSLAADGTWHSEYILCLDYINMLLKEEPLKNCGFALISRIERIFSLYAKERSDLSSTTLTAADVPWPEVIEACIETLLSWVHTLSGVENVHYLPQNLHEFKQPPLWTEATTETVKFIKKNSETRKKTWTSKIHDMTIEVEEELTRLTKPHSRLNVSERESFVNDDMEDTARCFERNLGKEKRNWKRFEDKLRDILDEEDPEVSNLGVPRQGVKRKNPSGSGYRPGKANLKKGASSIDLDLPDINLTLNHFETSLVSLQDSLTMHRYLERISEKKLRETVEELE